MVGEDIKQRIVNKPDLIIARLPKKSKDAFLKFANDEFCSDYGMCLKHLLDFYFGLIPSGVEHIEEQIVRLTDEIEQIKTTLIPASKEEVKLMSGKRIGVKENG